MSLAVLAACSTDDFQSQTNVAEETSPVQFELINGNNDVTRASWDNANKIVSFSAADGDLFTLYHGGALAGTVLSGLENATYKAAGSPATLSTPSIIKPGKAVMVWPVDTAFNIGSADNFSISIPVAQTDFVNQVPYVSDLISIGAYGPYNEDPAEGPVTAWNTAGKDRKYPVFMRQMGSLLTLKADYAGTDKTLAALEAGEDGITPITVDKITIGTAAATAFTKQIPVQFLGANANWPAVTTLNHSWVNVTDFDVAGIAAADQTTFLSAEDKSLIADNKGAKIIMLPQATINDATPDPNDATLKEGVKDASVTVSTIYGKVFIQNPLVPATKTMYTAAEYADSWARYMSATGTEEVYETQDASTTSDPSDTDKDGKYKTTTTVQEGMMQTINWFSDVNTAGSGRVVSAGNVKGEHIGGLLTRYVKVLLTHLDMSELHIKSDKQLRDAARVWEKMGLAPVTVFLDGDANGEFAISQKTIKVINDINETAGALAFTVKPCKIAGEACPTIVITGGGDVPNIPFITSNGATRADVALNAGETWNWKGTIKVAEILPATVPATAHIKSIINRGTMVNAETATLNVENNAGTKLINVPFENAEGAVWNITAGDLNVQFDVTNYGTVNIAKGAEYHQDGNPFVTKFDNEATDLPSRFGGADAKIGLVNNSGVFATVDGAKINNYGLIEHLEKSAKTYVSTNMQTGAGFNTPWAPTLKIGRINLPIDNKDEDNVSVKAATTAPGFVSVTVRKDNGAPANGKLDLSSVGEYVNYCIIESGITEISKVSNKIKYLEFNDVDNNEIAWNLGGTSSSLKSATYDGLIVLSPVNIKLFTTINVNKATYIKAKMYVGGTFNTVGWNGYYGNTTTDAATMYITY